MKETKEKIMFVLEKLFAGETIELKFKSNIRHKIILHNNKLMITSINDIQLEDDPLTCDISLNDFIDMCGRFVK